MPLDTSLVVDRQAIVSTDTNRAGIRYHSNVEVESTIAISLGFNSRTGTGTSCRRTWREQGNVGANRRDSSIYP